MKIHVVQVTQVQSQRKLRNDGDGDVTVFNDQAFPMFGLEVIFQELLSKATSVV